MDVNTGGHSLSTEEQRSAEAVLQQAPVAYLALIDQGPYVVPVSFAYDPGKTPRLLLHSGEGRKARALAGDARVCLAVTAHATFTPGPSPCADGFAYRSVLVWGRAERLEDRSEREQALRAIVAKYDPAAADQPFDENDFAQTLVFSVTIDALSYKERPRR